MGRLNLIESKDKYGKTYCTYEMRCLRHTSATQILAISKDWNIVRPALGHNIGTPTFKNYTGVSEQPLDPMSSNNNMGMSTSMSMNKYTQCTKIMDCSTHKKLSENMDFIEIGLVQSENTISMSAITTISHTTHSATVIEITTCKSFSETIFIKRPVLFPKII